MSAEFTKEMKRSHTILAPDMFPTHMELLQAIFRIHGYRIVIARDEGKKVIDTGLKYLHNDVCYPAICAVGQQLYALESGQFDPKKTALIMFQTGGGCRASNYIMLLRKALHNMGMDEVPVISLSLSGLERSPGFRFTPGMMLSAIRAVIYGDMLLLLKNQTLPYEISKGDTAKTVEKWIGELTEQFRHGRGLSRRALRRNLRAMAEDFHRIPREKKELTKVGIVGEIYVKYAAFGNNGLEKFLLSQGCEYMVPGVLGFFQYCFANMEMDHRYYGKPLRNVWAGNLMLHFADRWEREMLLALADYPEFVSPVSFDRVKELADRVIDRGVKMGEGWLLPGETAELIEKGYVNVICAQPFGCLPNHIVGKGTVRRLRELYPQANIFPVDYDAGASRVNQENRIKLMLAIARDEASEAEAAAERSPALV
jgi:predicted nucleotide-binding protein (sugar kinase/HSP70/actin superfamily)